VNANFLCCQCYITEAKPSTFCEDFIDFPFSFVLSFKKPSACKQKRLTGAMAKKETSAGVVVDWGHLDALVKDCLPAKTWTEKTDLGFEQIATTEAKVSFMKERLGSHNLRNSK
jgi:hypothetical protein